MHGLVWSPARSSHEHIEEDLNASVFSEARRAFTLTKETMMLLLRWVRDTTGAASQVREREQRGAAAATVHSRQSVPRQQAGTMAPLAAATAARWILLIVSCTIAAVSAIHSSPPPGYKHTAFRLIVPQYAIDGGTLHWHDALRHAAFLSLRRGIGSHDSNSEMTLWRRVSAASVLPMELARPVHEDADITTLASGVLMSEAGRLSFAPEAALQEPGVAPVKVSALWSVLRVRHSGPGLSAPRIEYYFTVQPASHMTLLDHVDKVRNKIVYKKPLPRPKPTYFYKEVTIPTVYSNVPGQYYTPQFLANYRNVVQKFVQKPETDEPVEEQRAIAEPFYVPRYSSTSPPSFPRLSQLVPQQNAPKLVTVVIPRRAVDHATQGSQGSVRYERVTLRPHVEPRTSDVAASAETEEMVEVPTIQRIPTTTTTTPKPTTITPKSSTTTPKSTTASSDETATEETTTEQVTTLAP